MLQGGQSKRGPSPHLGIGVAKGLAKEACGFWVVEPSQRQCCRPAALRIGTIERFLKGGIPTTAIRQGEDLEASVVLPITDA